MINLRTLALTAAGICSLALTACSHKHSEVDALNAVQPVGSAFTQYLAEEYRDFVNFRFYEGKDRPDGIHFARKGLAAASGEAVLPEPISDWNLTPPALQELSSARNRLLAVYDIGARQIAPQISAVAQARFDCWIEFEEEHAADETSSCQTEFLNAMDQLEGSIQAPALPEIVAEQPLEVIEPLTPDEAMYLVFFDFDSYDVGPGGSNVLDAVADEAASRGVTGVKIVGHTDSAGPEKYNEKLALKRANAVRTALTARGIDANIITVEGRGENELLVSTPDNVREPANRRAQITFE